MMNLLRTVRKLVLGETWALPIAVALALGGAALVRALVGAQGWWHDGGGFVLLGLTVAAFVAVVSSGRPPRR